MLCHVFWSQVEIRSFVLFGGGSTGTVVIDKICSKVYIYTYIFIFKHVFFSQVVIKLCRRSHMSKVLTELCVFAAVKIYP